MGRRTRLAMFGAGGVVILAIVIWLAVRGGDDARPSSGGGEATSVEARPGNEASASAPRNTVDSEMADFFSALPKASAPADDDASPPSIDRLAGAWRATIVSVDMPGEDAPLLDLGSLKPFSFTIKPAAGGWRMASADGRGQPREVVSTPFGLRARAEGARDLRLSLRGEVLVGIIELAQPARGRMEFHATREP